MNRQALAAGWKRRSGILKPGFALAHWVYQAS
jgi:hypothetical protein